MAEHRGEIIGCIQILMGKPLAHINHLAVLPAYEVQGPAYWLFRAAVSVLVNSGVDACMTMVDDDRMKGLLTKLGATPTGAGEMYVKRLPRK